MTLTTHGIALRLKVKRNCPFWAKVAEDDGDTEMQDVVEATYVDDECIILVASTAKALDLAIDALLQHLICIFRTYAFKINWARGKSEAMLVYRGRGSQEARQQRLLPDGSMCVKLPVDADADYLHVVRSYKHVGSAVTDDGSLAENAKLRARSALSAYATLACRLFSSESITAQLKLDFARSLVFSRLLYNTHLWQAEQSFAV